ncbi:MAG: nicotinamide riboside transporter PnuC [Sedimentisphaerales bacterium]|jgi:nicotinamide mononucleotide transporter
MSIFSVHNVFFTVLGYPMSYIELSATLLITVYVLLITRKIVWAWPLGIFTFSLFAVLFYQVRLYSDFFEQFYYVGNCFYGWYVWLAARKKAQEGGKELEVSYTSGKGRLIAAAIIIIGGTAAGFAMSRIHTWLPALFPQQAAYPYIDATATVMGFVAAGLMTHRKIEAWLLWLCVNSICIGLYYARDVKFVAILYIFFLGLAVNGLISWGKGLRLKANSVKRS